MHYQLIDYYDALLSVVCRFSCCDALCDELLSTLTCNDIVLGDSFCCGLVGVAFAVLFRRPLRTPQAFGRRICSH